MIPFVSIHVARTLHQQGKPFRVKLRYQGYTDNGNRSDKWWLLAYEGKGNRPLVSCNHGKTGTDGRKVPYQWTFQKCSKTCGDKLAKGYDYITCTSHSMPRAPKPQPKVVLEGVFAEIRKIIEITKDHFECFDANGGFLLDLTETGANQVASADTFRISLERL